MVEGAPSGDQCIPLPWETMHGPEQSQCQRPTRQAAIVRPRGYLNVPCTRKPIICGMLSVVCVRQGAIWSPVASTPILRQDRCDCNIRYVAPVAAATSPGAARFGYVTAKAWFSPFQAFGMKVVPTTKRTGLCATFHCFDRSCRKGERGDADLRFSMHQVRPHHHLPRAAFERGHAPLRELWLDEDATLVFNVLGASGKLTDRRELPDRHLSARIGTAELT